MPESRFPLIAILLVLIAIFAIYGIILMPGNTFAGMDFLNLTYPRTALGRDAVAAGHLPLWNWYEWGGAPLLATLLGALFYPVTWVAMALPLPYGLQVFVFFHMALAAIGTWVLARRALRLTAMSSAYAAIAYAGNAFFIGRIEQSQVVAVNALLPWLICVVWRAVFRRNPERPWVAVVWTMTLLAGHPQFAAFNLLGAVGFVGMVALMIPRQGDWQFRRAAARWWRVVWQLTMGTALAAAQLLPTWELAQLSERIWPYPDPTMPELAWKNLPALVVPRFYNFITGQVGRVMDYTELGLYAGVLTVPLALAALYWASVGKKHSGSIVAVARRRVIFAACGVWLIAMFFALGSHAGLATVVYNYLPFFKQSRGAARSLNVAALMLALLSGQGLSWLAGAIARKRLSRDSLPVGSTPLRKTAAQIAAAFCLIAIADLAATHSSAIKSILVPREALLAAPLMPANIRIQLKSNAERAYRFMAFDSDIYLNNSAPAVAERIARLQPNLNSLAGIGLTDGYEEGLLPVRSRANLFRKYNRNLRGPSPDASLLAAMGARAMLTEYPISPDSGTWESASPQYPRTGVVPSFAPNAPPIYQWWRSNYPVAPVYALEELIPGRILPDQFLAQSQIDFPLRNNQKFPAGHTVREHVFSKIPPRAFAAAKDHFTFKSDFSDWNSLTFAIQNPTSAALVMIPPYPGWKTSGKNLAETDIKPLNSLCYVTQFRNRGPVPDPVKLIFSPFSFRLGLFVSLITGTLLLITMLPDIPTVRSTH